MYLYLFTTVDGTVEEWSGEEEGSQISDNIGPWVGVTVGDPRVTLLHLATDPPTVGTHSHAHRVPNRDPKCKSLTNLCQ